MTRSHETEVVISRDDDVIDETDAQQIAALAKPLGNLDVFRARVWASTGVIVAYENGLGVADYGALESFARMNDRCRKRPDRNHVCANRAMLRVEQYNHKLLAIETVE
jgi:hypothetical protein